MPCRRPFWRRTGRAARRPPKRTLSALWKRLKAPCDSPIEPCPLQQVIASKAPVTLTHTHYDAKGNEVVRANLEVDESGLGCNRPLRLGADGKLYQMRLSDDGVDLTRFVR